MALGRVSVVLVCGLAFLLASTPARNSDLWLHLASGRWLSAGRPPNGSEPFSSATEGVFWVNHTWLSDILLYWIYKLGDGAALVVVKAVVTALLAGLLLCFRRRGEEGGILVLAGLTAVLALGPWLLLQPFLLSLLGVVLTLYLLERPNLHEGAAAERARKGRWLLVPWFALWANLDGWFVLGPLLVGLYAVGELLLWLRSGRSRDPARHLLLLFCAGLAACLVTPYHYRIFAWPTWLGMTAAEQALQHDPLGPTMVVSPFAARFVSSSLFRSPGAWAYYFLLAAGAASFVLSLRTLHPGRLLAWLALAVLSIYQARSISFFAVTAAPFLALNVQEWSRNRRQPPAADAAGCCIGILLLLLAWPGWLQPTPYQPRGWTVEPDGSLVRMADQLKRWHDRSYFQSDRFSLTFSPEAAHYLAWFCPEEKGFVDSRWPLFGRVADDYVQMRRCLLDGDRGAKTAELASLLEAHRIDRILVYDPDGERKARVYRHLFRSSAEWELLAVEGGATLFRRRRGTAPSLGAFDYRRAAYHPASDWWAPPAPRPPRPPHWLDILYRRPDCSAADREEAALHLLSFGLQQEELAVQWSLAQATGLIGSRPGLPLAARLYSPLPSLPAAPEPLWLAVRAARRALAVNPDDGQAFLRLGQAYYRLSQQTHEASWQTMLPELAALRQAQILTALENAVLRRPDLAQAHALLGELYFESGQMDRCLDHRRAHLRIAEQADKHSAAVAVLRESVKKMEELVEQSEKTYQANLTGKTDPSKVLNRAQLAATHGLSRKALEMMEESHPAIYGRSGAEYRLDLMMQSGHSCEVLAVLEPGLERKIAEYHWLKARAAAGCGDYAEADAELDRDTERFRRIGLSPNMFVPVRPAIAFHAARAVLTRPSEAEGVAGRIIAMRSQVQSLDSLMMAVALLRQEADRQVLRGLLALEAGAVDTARQHFRAALNVWDSDAAAEAGAGLDFPARPIAQEMLRRIQE
jgi:tetratricopeptide (TPR) repeat protein